VKPTNEELDAFQAETADSILLKINESPKSDCVSEAMDLMVTRLVRSGAVLSFLYTSPLPSDWSFDGASILRTSYDIMLQGLYVMAKPEQQTERAQLYLDYMHIEHWQRIKLADRNDTAVARHIRNSPRRSKAEPQLKEAYERVKHKYLTKGRGKREKKIRKNWYPGTLCELAGESKLVPEYEWIQKMLSGAVHSSPWTLKEGTMIEPYLLTSWHFSLAFRILGAYATYMDVSLNEDEQSLVDMAKKSLC
jgi:hypothetical protein